MKKTALILILNLFFVSVFCQETTVKDQLKVLAKQLESKYTGRDGIKIALLQFRTSNDFITRFNDFARDEFVVNYQGSSKFSLIDPIISARVVEAKEWNLQKVNSFPYYDELGQAFMQQAGYVPNGYVYGEIRDNEMSITITAFLVLSGSTDAKAVAAVTFDSNEQTDYLLGKPVKKRAKPQAAVVQEQVVQPVQPVVQPQVQPQQPQPQVVPQTTAVELPSADYDDFKIKITEVKLLGSNMIINFLATNNANLDKDLTIVGTPTRFFDSNGNEYVNEEKALGSSTGTYNAYLKLIPGIPVKGQLNFSNVPPDADIKMIEIGINEGKISFRDLPVKR